MSRLTDHDRHFGPLTFGRTGSYRPFSFYIDSGDEEEGKALPRIMLWVFGWVFALPFFSLLQPWRIKHIAGWDAANVARIGRNWYYETHARRYGFSLTEGHLCIYLGVQTNDSDTTKDWSCFLPWTQWRHVRHTLLNLDGTVFHDLNQGPGFLMRWKEERVIKDRHPSTAFKIRDFDGAEILVTCRIEEMEWRFGTGWFKWLSLFRAHKVRRSLNLDFSSEVGTGKGSWKGGMTGTGIEMVSGDSVESSFRRFCDEEHRQKEGGYRLTYVGPA